jgi:hypothetical protein
VSRGPTLGSVLAGFAKEAPELMGRVASELSKLGFSLDLGPMVPDARVEAKKQDNRIASQLDELEELDKKGESPR